MPKLNEEQDQYYGGSTDRPIAVPITVDPANLDSIGLVVEALNAEGYRNVYKEYSMKKGGRATISMLPGSFIPFFQRLRQAQARRPDAAALSRHAGSRCPCVEYIFPLAAVRICTA